MTREQDPDATETTQRAAAAGASRCDTCSFDPALYTPTDARRTVVHAADLVARAVEGMSPDLWDAQPGDGRPSIAAHTAATAATFGAAPAPDDDPPLVLARLAAAARGGAALAAPRATELAHHALHAAVHAADCRRALGDGIVPMHGSVAQVSASGGGVPKTAVAAATVDSRGVVGDRQAARVHHGRQWQGLCLFGAEVLDALAAEGHPIGPGSTGENLTLAGLDWSRLRGGLLVTVGDAVCRLSVPATPCAKNARWFADGDPNRIDHDRHPGWSRWYATVVTPGEVRTGDPVTVR